MEGICCPRSNVLPCSLPIVAAHIDLFPPVLPYYRVLPRTEAFQRYYDELLLSQRRRVSQLSYKRFLHV